MTDVNRVPQIEMPGQRGKVVGIVVHVVAVTGLGGSPMTAPVVGDDAIAMLEKEQHLRIPVIGRQRPAMAEHDRLTGSPVLVEDFRAVRNCDDAHLIPPIDRFELKPASTGYPIDPRGFPGGHLQGSPDVSPQPITTPSRLAPPGTGHSALIPYMAMIRISASSLGQRNRWRT
jgi:hypothetical protein